MFRIASLMIFAASLCAQGLVKHSDTPQAMPQPELPYYDWNACPGEGCNYGKWIARQPTKVFNTYRRERRKVALLKPGDKVVAIRGLVVTSNPGIIHVDRDLPDKSLRRGDTILTYAYRGEGVSAVWLKGKYFSNFDISFTKWPDGLGCQGTYCAATYLTLGVKAWWAEVKLPSGKLVWVDMDHADFDGSCSLSRTR